MLEASQPNGADIAHKSLDATLIFETMQGKLKEKEHLYPENQKAFRKAILPLLEKACDDPRLEVALRPALTRADGALQREQNEKLTKILEQVETGTSVIPSDDLQMLAARFEVEGAFDKSDDELCGYLIDKAKEYRAFRQQIAAMDETIAQVAQLKHDAEQAASDLDFEKVETLLASADFAETKLNAQTKITRANNALLRGKTQQAFDIFSAVADSFRSIDPTAPTHLRLQLAGSLQQYGLRYGSDGLLLFERMIRDALRETSRDLSAPLWALAQNNLAIALRNQGIRTQGTEGAELLAEAITAYRNALDVYNLADHPVGWAMTQNNLANALSDQGTRTQGAKGSELLAQAVTAYRSALDVRTRADQPLDWASTQNNLANALSDQGTRTQGAKGAELLAQAVTAYRNALSVYTRTDQPMHWAMTQNNLAAALKDQSIRIRGIKSTELLAKAVTAYRNALKVRTRTDYPLDWASTQNNLATSLLSQGTSTQGADGAKLLAQAATAYSAALEVRTRADHPVDWAMTQENIAICEEARADHDSCPDPRPPLTAALEAVKNALTIFDPEHMSYYHTKATYLRDQIQAKLDALLPA